MNRRLALAAAAGALAAVVAGSASAAVTALTFATPGAAEPQVYIGGYVAGTTTIDTALHATLALTLLSKSNNGYTWNFGYTLNNTSTEASRLSTLGWDVSTDFSAVSGVSGLFTQYAQDGNLASLGSKDFCLKASNGAGCSGGGNGGVSSGQSGTGLFSLSFQNSITTYTTVKTPIYNNKGKLTGYKTESVPVITTVAAPTSLTFDDFGVHYQSLAGGGSTVGVPGDAPLPPPPPPPPPPHIIDQQGSDGGGLSVAVPEPASWALMILGFGAVGAVLRRRRGMLTA